MKIKQEEEEEDYSVLQTTELCKYQLLDGILEKLTLHFESSKFEYKTSQAASQLFRIKIILSVTRETIFFYFKCSTNFLFKFLFLKSVS